MKIMVIGGAGYIGSHVVRELLDTGHSLLVYDNFSTGLRKNLHIEAEFIQGDIRYFSDILKVMKDFKPEGVVHLAALKAAGESMLKPEKYSETNIAGSINILNACVETGVSSIIFSSTAAVYGNPLYLPIDERHPTTPENYYGFTKLKVEEMLRWYERLHGLKFAALRYFNAAGYDLGGRILGLERYPANLLPVVMETALGLRQEVEIFGDDYETRDGTGVRDYIHVSDLAEAHVSVFDYLKRTGKSLTVNLASGEAYSVLEVIEKAREITGRSIPFRITSRRIGDPAKVFATAQKAEKLLGWKARFSDLDTLISSTWWAYRKSFEEGLLKPRHF